MEGGGSYHTVKLYCQISTRQLSLLTVIITVLLEINCGSYIFPELCNYKGGGGGDLLVDRSYYLEFRSIPWKTNDERGDGGRGSSKLRIKLTDKLKIC